jgi:hypothetical protein
MSRLVQDLRAHVNSRNVAKIQEKLAELEDAASYLPDVVRLFLGIRGAIGGDIRPADPARAAQLLRRLDEVENQVRARHPSAGAELNALADEVTLAVGEAKGAKAHRCSRGHSLSPGERICRECGEDTWALDAGFPGRR